VIINYISLIANFDHLGYIGYMDNIILMCPKKEQSRDLY